jgi:hypothetical protein
MNSVNRDYEEKDIVQFIKEEMDRISTQYPLMKESILSLAQAFEIWFLHQETGIDYGEAAKHILDGSNDCGVDFIWIDNNNREVSVGQCEYDTKWERTIASEHKAIETFSAFINYLNTSKLPEKITESSQNLWRLARLKLREGYTLDYIYLTPKHFSQQQEERIRAKSGISNYFFITHDTLLERGHEFLDGQTGMCNFEIKYMTEPTNIPYDFGSVYVFPANVREVYNIVKKHKERHRLRALFASNVRAYLSTKKRSKEIADAMKTTLKNNPREFLICNNGITIQCNKVSVIDKGLKLHRASISNGCQTAMNIYMFFEENESANPNAEVLVTVVELAKEAPRLAADIARSRNFQNPVDNRDLMSNHFRLVCLHHRLLGDRIGGSEKRYYLLRKQGEKQTLLKEEPQARGQFMWIDADYLARCIAALIRQNPFISRQGTNDLFGKYFNQIFPDVSDPTHTRCKFSWWLAWLVDYSYNPKARWKGIKDIYYQRDFKSHAYWVATALIAKKLKENYSFSESLEKRFVEKAEKWHFKSRSPDAQEFEELTFNMVDAAFRLLYVISKSLLGKKLRRAREPYTTYEDFFKGPTYEEIISELRKGKMKTYQYNFDRSMRKLYDYLRSS